MRKTLFAAVALMMASGAVAGEQRDAVMDLLNAIETPGSEADFQALGDGVDAELMAIVDDGAVPSSRRGRAVSALQFYKTDAVRTFLEAHLQAADHSIIRRKAAYSLTAAFGASAVEVVGAVLSDEDAQLRIAAVNALGSVADPAARQVLEAHLAAEPDEAVKTAIAKQLNPEVK